MRDISTEQELCIFRMTILGASFGMCGSIPLFQNATTDMLIYLAMSIAGGAAGFGAGYSGVAVQNYCSTSTISPPVPRVMGTEEQDREMHSNTPNSMSPS